MMKTNLSKKNQKIVALAIAAPLVVFAAIYMTYPRTVTHVGGQLNPFEMDYKVGTSEIIAIGTVKNVEVKVVTGKLYGDPSKGEPAVEDIQSLYQFVTIQVDRYILDRTGQSASEITFRDVVSGCFDVLEFECVSHEYSIEFNIGEKALFFIANVDGNLDSLGYTSKLKIDGTKVQSKYFEDKDEAPKDLATFEKQIKDSIEKQKAK